MANLSGILDQVRSLLGRHTSVLAHDRSDVSSTSVLPKVVLALLVMTALFLVAIVGLAVVVVFAMSNSASTDPTGAAPTAEEATVDIPSAETAEVTKADAPGTNSELTEEVRAKAIKVDAPELPATRVERAVEQPKAVVKVKGPSTVADGARTPNAKSPGALVDDSRAYKPKQLPDPAPHRPPRRAQPDPPRFKLNPTFAPVSR